MTRKPLHAVFFLVGATFTLAALTLVGCPSPAKNAQPDAEAGAQVRSAYYGDAGPECVAACAAIDRFPECAAEAHPDGGPGCAPVMCGVAVPIFHFDVACPVRAKSVDEMRKCGLRCATL